MADQDNVTPIEDGKEFNDAELGSIVDKLYGGNNNAPKEEVQEKAPAPEVKSEEPISKEDIHVPSPDLPPGFDPTATKASKDVEQNVDLDDKVIDEAIENAPNDNYKNNIVAMRKSLQSKKEELEKQTSLLNELKEKDISLAYVKLHSLKSNIIPFRIFLLVFILFISLNFIFSNLKSAMSLAFVILVFLLRLYDY